uniref:NADH-ubiquinone oxidoreductase chain 2 n=1 Tax=Tuber microsphaerosporum TaxID=1455713 RepID=A0A8F6D6M1_9PEZI|nr:NADH dehydrogenase subunit 2 [Tuber microsphaerosporum]
MLFVSSTLLLLVNAVTLRRERSILFNRVAVLILLYSGIICYDSLNITSLDTGIGIYGGLFHSTSITHSFDLFICIIGAIVLQLTAYYPRRLQEPMGTTGKKKSFFLTNYASSSLEKSKNNMGEQSGVRKFSTSVKTSGLPLNPNFISGFTDGDGSFSVVITKCANRLGWTVSPIFTIGLHAKDLEFLNIIQSYFGVGKIYTKQSDGSIHYRVWSVKDLINIIIPHFDKYPLVTQKRADFELFKQIVQILAKKEKLTIEDLTKIVALKASINLGLSPVLKESFPNITPALRTVFDVPKVLDPHWLAGFIEAEGSFVVSIQKSYNNKNGFLTSLRFILSQHSRDLQLMNSIMKYFNCGLVYSTSTRGESVEFRMNKFLDVWNTLIPFLKKYPLQGSKLRDFSDFAKAAALMYSKDHLTIAGLDKIVNIKKGMNQLRQMSSMATAAVQPELKKERETLGWALIPEYPLIILFILIGAIFLMSSSDLVSMFLAIELQSYGLYIFATLYRNSELATSAGLTYFLLGGLSSCFILLGSCLLYLNFGITNLDGLYVLSSLSEVFHFWSPDVYDGIPTVVTTFVAIIPKISIFIFLLELVHYTSQSMFEFNWTSLLLLSSFLSLIIGSVVGLVQHRIKRLLAYSTISHVGFLLLALVINSTESVQAFLFYLMQYSLSNINVFFILIIIGYYLLEISRNADRRLLEINNSPVQLISQFQGFFFINPFLAISLAITLFSFAGLPPLIGFFAKQQVLSAALNQGFYFLVLVGILTSVVSAVYYLRIIKLVFFDKNESIADNKYSYYFASSSPFLTITISVLTLIILLFIFSPTEWLSITNTLALVLFNP